jgi:PEP-CTERM motif
MRRGQPRARLTQQRHGVVMRPADHHLIKPQRGNSRRGAVHSPREEKNMIGTKSLVFGALVAALAMPAHAIDVVLNANGEWTQFKVDELESLSNGTEWIDNNDTLAAGHGSPLSLLFTIGAGSFGTLTVVDGGFAGDTFTLTNFGAPLGATSAVATTTVDTAANLGYDFNAALTDSRFSSGVYTLGAGSYRIGGALAQSVTFGGAPLNSTVGALRLIVSAVPEPGSVALLLAGLGLMACVARRRRS